MKRNSSSESLVTGEGKKRKEVEVKGIKRDVPSFSFSFSLILLSFFLHPENLAHAALKNDVKYIQPTV